MNGLPPEWTELLKGAGVKKSDLRNRDTCVFIVNTVAQAINVR